MPNPAPIDWRTAASVIGQTMRRPSCVLVRATGCTYCESCDTELVGADRDSGAVAFVDVSEDGRGSHLTGTGLEVCAECCRTGDVRWGMRAAGARFLAQASEFAGQGEDQEAGDCAELAMVAMRAVRGAIVPPGYVWFPFGVCEDGRTNACAGVA